ncbi:hypothetical protein ET495_09790 [Xylanimonas allomyrinae]|uniref:histidine kinase n=1 Tax=Xylanimonas allomyrinae TaxID=2509459 RepID=A0A4P6EMF6_9MICO|nr:histidine kinase [Xylanimonas allomyrinae]QAY63496.1 hypothetical protein ET495_09790 [Xylanimonas allomyrinae]
MTTHVVASDADEYTRRFVGVSMLVRLLAILVAFVGLVGQTMTLPVLACAVALTASGLAVLMSERVAAFLAEHPFAFVADVLVTLAVIAVLGTETPFVLVTISTAIVVGFLLQPALAALCAVVLVAGYLLVETLQPPAVAGFMLTAGVPALYVGAVAVGGAARHAHRAHVAASRQAGEALLAAAAAEERARLAREMHDSLGKTLHGIALGAQALPRVVERDPARAQGFAAELAQGANRAALEARQLLARMRADQPDRPLAEVLRSQCDAWQRESGVPCHFRTDGAVDLSTSARYELLAIVAEALENARRHANARLVTVRLTGHADGGLEAVVTDDGAGFVVGPRARSPHGHFGLTGMAERAAFAGLSLQVRSTPAGGTTVVVSHPGHAREAA